MKGKELKLKDVMCGDRPCYLVSGDYVGKGTDGEPLIRNITIIKRLDNYRIKNFEKQGEQMPADKVVKFNVGDKVYNIKNRFECTIESIDDTTYYCDTTNFDIKDQNNWELVEQKPAEWSDDDEKRMNHIIQFLEDKDRWKDSERAFPIEEDIRWLKSRFFQKHWKPSEEQMEVLKEICVLKKSTATGAVLCELYHDLEKLREE